MLLVIFYQASIFKGHVAEIEGTLYLHYVTESIYIT
jgi:hypothetical protein